MLVGMRILPIAIIFAIIVSFVPTSSGISLNFKYVSVNFNPERASVDIQINNTTVSIRFSKIFAGNFIFPQMWNGDIKDLNISEDRGKKEGMGQYIHVRMWGNVKLQRMIGFGKDCKSFVVIDFFIAESPYRKGDYEIDNSTIRYDLDIKTDCPSDFLIVEQDITIGGVSYEPYISTDHHWSKIYRTDRWTSINISDSIGDIGFGKGERMDYHLIWNKSSMNGTMYTYNGNKFSMFFKYPNSGEIRDDPIFKVPLPIFIENIPQEIKRAANYLIEHAFSIGIGVAASVVLVFIPYLRRKL